jgi:catechol 2,3-dioxygenase-like lactoylglutathione lyase family enzyme
MSTTQADFLPVTDRAGRHVIRPLIHHFGIATTRNEEMVAWYRDVLGLEIVAEPGNPLPKMTFVTSDDHHHRGGFFSPPTLKDNPERLDYSRIQHIAWEYADVDQLLESWERILTLGIEPVSAWCHSFSFAIYYKDPDNNTVELGAQAFEVVRDGLAYARTPEWSKNPNGWSIDPGKLKQARAQGVGLDELRTRAMAGEYRPEVEPSPMTTW